MTDRDYLWCALNLSLDREEALNRLCPGCRSRAEEALCPSCGAPLGEHGESGSFDRSRFEAMKEGMGHE